MRGHFEANMVAIRCQKMKYLLVEPESSFATPALVASGCPDWAILACYLVEGGLLQHTACEEFWASAD